MVQEIIARLHWLVSCDDLLTDGTELHVPVVLGGCVSTIHTTWRSVAPAAFLKHRPQSVAITPLNSVTALTALAAVDEQAVLAASTAY